MNTTFIALGSNLDSPPLQIHKAIKALSSLGTLESISRWYQSSPLGPSDQPDYLNGAVKLKTQLDPFELLSSLHDIENQHERKRTIRWGARTLDLDILLFNQSSLYSKHLIIPHKELTHRDFVVLPLLDIDEMLTLPDGQLLSGVLSTLPNNDLQQLSSIDAYA